MKILDVYADDHRGIENLETHHIQTACLCTWKGKDHMMSNYITLLTRQRHSPDIEKSEAPPPRGLYVPTLGSRCSPEIGRFEKSTDTTGISSVGFVNGSGREVARAGSG